MIRNQPATNPLPIGHRCLTLKTAVLKTEQRLRKTGDFKAVYTRGRSYVHPAMVVYVLRREGENARIGFSVSKKLGPSTARNRVKRRLREAARPLIRKLQPGLDVVVVARAPITDLSAAETGAVLEAQLSRASGL